MKNLLIRCYLLYCFLTGRATEQESAKPDAPIQKPTPHSPIKPMSEMTDPREIFQRQEEIRKHMASYRS